MKPTLSICIPTFKRLARRAFEIVLAPFVFILCLCLPRRILEDLTGTTHERP